MPPPIVGILNPMDSSLRVWALYNECPIHLAWLLWSGWILWTTWTTIPGLANDAPSLTVSTETHPRPPKPDPVKSTSGVLSSLTPAKSAPVINNGSPTILGKRSYEQHNGVDGESSGRPPFHRGWARSAGL